MNRSPSSTPPDPDPNVDANTTVIATKLFAPLPRHPVVRRPRLDRILDRALTVPLTLIVAPAGWGKSTLVVDWLQRAGTRAGWVWLRSTISRRSATPWYTSSSTGY